MTTSVNSEGSFYYSNSTIGVQQQIALSEGPGSLIRRELQRSGLSRKYRTIMELLGTKGTTNTGTTADSSGTELKGDLRERLEILLEVVLSEIDEGIMGKMSDLQKKAKEMKDITEKQAEKKPGLTSGLNTESSVLQVQLTMLVNRRQQFVEAISNSIKSMHDGDMNTVRRIV